MLWQIVQTPTIQCRRRHQPLVLACTVMVHHATVTATIAAHTLKAVAQPIIRVATRMRILLATAARVQSKAPWRQRQARARQSRLQALVLACTVMVHHATVTAIIAAHTLKAVAQPIIRVATQMRMPLATVARAQSRARQSRLVLRPSRLFRTRARGG
jgi:hypothetical protein